MGAHIDALRKAGFTIKSPLPKEYEQAIEGLHSDEVEALIKVKQSLDKAQAKTHPDAGPYREYFLPF